jgi:hypothetical protein
MANCHNKEALRAFKIIIQYYNAHSSDEKLEINVFSMEDLQRHLLVSTSMEQMNITDFLN